MKAEFVCNGIVRRKFNEGIQKFDVIEEYMLNGTENFPYNGDSWFRFIAVFL